MVFVEFRLPFIFNLADQILFRLPFLKYGLEIIAIGRPLFRALDWIIFSKNLFHQFPRFNIYYLEKGGTTLFLSLYVKYIEFINE